MTPYSVLVDIINIIRADYVDVLLSLKDPPRILICDCPDRIAANLKNRAPSLLGPNNGMICEPTDDNVRLAEAGKLRVHVPSIEIENDDEDSRILICYDRFHQNNSSIKKELVRRVDFIENMPVTNTEVCSND